MTARANQLAGLKGTFHLTHSTTKLLKEGQCIGAGSPRVKREILNKIDRGQGTLSTLCAATPSLVIPAKAGIPFGLPY
jgi:hypothetical protein